MTTVNSKYQGTLAKWAWNMPVFAGNPFLSRGSVSLTLVHRKFILFSRPDVKSVLD